MGIFIPILLIITSYLLGSIPWALIISKLFKGIDIRDYGSKNMGATNVLRVLGPKYGILVFGLDALKAGLIIGLFSSGLLNWQADWMILKIHPLIYGIFAIIGHMFPIFAQFKGGKGVSCSAGILIAYQPLVLLGTLVVFGLVFWWKRYISLGSMVAAVTALILSFFAKTNYGEIDWIFVIIIATLAIFIFIRHIPNIKRLLQHTEPKTSFHKKKDDK